MTTWFTDADLSGAGEFVEAEVWLATEFTVPAGTASFRWRWPTLAPTVTPVIRVYSAGGTLVAGPISFDSTTVDTWNTAGAGSPVALSAGTYRVVVNTTRYPAKGGFFASSITRNGVTGVQSRFGSPGSAPTSTSTATYYVDIDFTASGGASPALVDTAAATDSLAVTVAVPLPDAGSATEARTSAATTPLADTASAAEAASGAATVPLADAGSAADSLSNGAGTPKPIGDTAAAVDTLNASVAAALADVAAAAESFTVAAAAALADAASATQALAITATATFGDSAAAAQVLTASVALPLTDIGTGVDAGQGADGTNLTRSFGDTSSSADQLRARRATIRPNTGTTVRPVAGVTPRP